MSENENIFVVITLLDNESAAFGAYEGLKHWDEARKDIELGSIGTISKVNGEIEIHVDRKDGKGILVKGVTGIVGSVLGPVTLVAGLVGSVVGSFTNRSEEHTPEELEKLGEEMDAGRVAMVVVCDEGEVEATAKQLESMGGTVKTYEVAQEAMLEAAEALEEAAAQEGE